MKSIESKITLTYVALAVALILGASLYSSSRVESYYKERLVQDMSRHAELITYVLQSDSTISFPEIDQRVEKISGIENVRITLISAGGKVLADSDVPSDHLERVENHLSRPEIQEALTHGVGVNSRHSATVGKDFLYVAKALADPQSVRAFPDLKFIRLSMPLEDYRTRINNLRFNIYLAGFIALLLVAGVSSVVSRRVARPIMEIARSIERIRAGNLNEHIPVSSHDEISQVAKAVNELVDKLRSDIVELEKLQRVRTEFLANVSHELRTPIFAIEGMLETLLNGAIDDPAVNRSFLQKAQANVTRLDALLRDLINISHMESGDLKLSFRYFRVNEFLESITKDFQPVADQRHVTLTHDLRTGTDTEVLGDRERLYQVLANLIENAVRYNREHGTVVVSTDNADGNVRVSVQDSGVGISQEHLPRIFERFYRVDKDRSREVGGTGLGLAIVKHIVDAHGSKVEVESVEGEGSKFSFFLRRD
ncbi:MAG: ATP-binding protein [Bacteroidota bacterium]